MTTTTATPSEVTTIQIPEQVDEATCPHCQGPLIVRSAAWGFRITVGPAIVKTGEPE